AAPRGMPMRLRHIFQAFFGCALLVPLAARAELPGDCDGDARVTVGELITAVDIALDTRSLKDCQPADADGDGQMSIADLVTDVGAALAPVPFVANQRIVYSDGLHNENTEMIRLGDRIVLIFRGGETGQVGSDAAHINVYESLDDGKTFAPISQVSA